MATVVIAAHNEEAVLGSCLDALVRGADPETKETLEIIVVANGCTDDTAAVARSYPGVTVLELTQGSKPLALNAGEAVATSSPRVYLDADIVVPPGGVDALAAALDAPGAMAAVPARELDVEGRPWPVRAYYAINERLPVFASGLFGRGMIALSAEGRLRFDRFPPMVADDLFLDSLFTAEEKRHVSTFATRVETPATTRELLNRLIRVRRGNAAMRQAGAQGAVAASVRAPDRWAWLREVVLPDPRLAGAGLVYAAISAIAALRARSGPTTSLDWGRSGSRGVATRSRSRSGSRFRR